MIHQEKGKLELDCCDNKSELFDMLLCNANNCNKLFHYSCLINKNINKKSITTKLCYITINLKILKY